MKTTQKYFAILMMLLTLLSCQKEELTPLVDPVTINELIDNKPIQFSFNATQTDIEEFGGDFSKFPLIGKLFQGLALVLVDTALMTTKGYEIKIDPIEIDLSAIEGTDLSSLEWVKVDAIKIFIDQAKKKDNLKFLKQLAIYADVPNDFEGIQRNEQGLVKLVSFESKKSALECDGQCLFMTVEDINWKSLIQNNTRLDIRPVILINSVPKSTMKLAVDVDFSVKVELGF